MQSGGQLSRSWALQLCLCSLYLRCSLYSNTKHKLGYTHQLFQMLATTLVGVTCVMIMRSQQWCPCTTRWYLTKGASAWENTPALELVQMQRNSISAGTATPTSNPNTMTVTFNNNLLNVQADVFSRSIGQAQLREAMAALRSYYNTSLNMTGWRFYCCCYY